MRGEMRPNRRYLMRDAIRGHQWPSVVRWRSKYGPNEGRNRRPSVAIRGELEEQVRRKVRRSRDGRRQLMLLLLLLLL